jgi:glycosyltransferase involved in cell wall biosynthesis
VDHRVQALFYANPDQYPPVINGSRLLVQAGFELDILCRSDAQNWNVSYPSGVRVTRIGNRKQSSWLEYLSFVVTVLREASPKAVLFIGHDMHGLLPARLLSMRYGRPTVYHCHDFADKKRALPLGSRLVRKFEQHFARSAELVIVPDADRAKVIARELRLKKEPLVVANAPLSRPAVVSGALREAITKNNRHFAKIVLRQGRIGVGHSIEATLHSIPLWLNQDWGFVVMGTGEASYVSKLNQIARDLGVENQFLVLPPVGYDQVHEFTLDANIGHALYDPIHINNEFIATASNKIMEYMEAGIPLLVSDTPPLTKLLGRHGCGLSADEKSPMSIAAAVNALLSDQKRAHQMGGAARQAFEQEFCYERQFAPVIDSIRSLMNQSESS